VATVPQTPETPCTATAPIGSSMPIRSTASTPTTAITPDTSPITTAAHGATNPDAAVTATSAASTPFSIIEMSGFRSTTQAVIAPLIAPAAAARFVVSATYAKNPTRLPVMTPRVEPGLNPNQPNQRLSVPRTAYG